MRIAVAVIASLWVAGCAGNDGISVEGIKAPANVTSLMLTNRPAEGVASCIAAMLHTSVQPSEGDFLIATAPPSSATYRVRTITDPLGRFVTEVDQTGSPATGEPLVSGCASK